MKNIFSFTAILFSSAAAMMAQPEFDYNKIKQKYPDENSYVLSDKTSVLIEIINDNLSITSRNETSTLLLNEKASSYSTRSIYYYDETEDIFDIKAVCYVPDEKNKLKKSEVKEIHSQKPMKEGIFYDDYKEYYFRYAGLKSGAVTSLGYSQKFKDPHLLDPFYFVSYSPVEEAEFTVTFPKEVRVKYLLAGKTEGIAMTRQENKKTITMTWLGKNLKSFDYAFDSYNIKKILPHVIFYIDEYETSGKKIKVLSNTAELHRWYVSHINSLRIPPVETVKALADSITRGIQSEEEKTKKIYYWVQENIKYVAFEQGLGGFIPRPASLVCSRRYGDCKDKSSLLYALLKAAGITSYFTWVGTRDIPYTYAELSSPMTDNHMILSMRNGDGWTFLDGTAFHLNYGFPSFPIQGKEAMISISADSFAIAKIPVVSKEKNYWTDSVSVSLDGKVLSGTGVSYFTGLMKSHMDNKYFDAATEKRDDDMKRIFQLGNNKCKTEMTGYKGEEGFEDTLFCFYTFSLPDYVSTIGKKLFVNLNLVKNYHGDRLDTLKEKGDRNFYLKSVRRQVYTIKIPERYSVTTLPPDSRFNERGLGFSVRYSKTKDAVNLTKELWIDDISFPESAFADWNKMYDVLNDVYSEVVVLEEK